MPILAAQGEGEDRLVDFFLSHHLREDRGDGVNRESVEAQPENAVEFADEVAGG